MLLLSNSDRELLELLGHVILAAETSHDASNFKKSEVPLTQSEAVRLLELLEQFAKSKLFLEGAYFAEHADDGNVVLDDRLREIYLSWRKRRGKSRVASSFTWSEFCIRLGFDSSEEAWMWPRHISMSAVRPMKLEHFQKMEYRLCNVAGVHPRVSALVMRLVASQTSSLSKLRNREVVFKKGSIQNFIDTSRVGLSKLLTNPDVLPMPKNQVVALTTIVEFRGHYTN